MLPIVREDQRVSFVSVVDGHDYELLRTGPEEALVSCSPEATRPPGSTLSLIVPEVYPSVVFQAEVTARLLPRDTTRAELHLRWVRITETRSRGELVRALRDVLSLRAKVRNPERDSLPVGATLVYDAARRYVQLERPRNAPRQARTRSRRRVATTTQQPTTASHRSIGDSG